MKRLQKLYYIYNGIALRMVSVLAPNQNSILGSTLLYYHTPFELDALQGNFFTKA